jgi:hypothetical protein
MELGSLTPRPRLGLVGRVALLIITAQQSNDFLISLSRNLSLVRNQYKSV